jgi:hypothetical protein
MKCPKCGLENRPDARFCKQCGQAFPAQVVSPPPGNICPACGATAKPGARFCPRCGKPLPAEPAQSYTPAHAAQPTRPPASQPYIPQPPGYARSPFQSPPPVAPTPPARRFPSWMLWIGIAAGLFCILALVVSAVMFGPRLLGSQSTATPSPSPTVEAPLPNTPTPESPPPTWTPIPTTAPLPSFGAQVAITASAAEIRVGDALTVTVTISNTGQIPFGSLRYQLLGQWGSSLGAPTGAAIGNEVDVPPGGSDTVIFVLEAIQPGTAQIHANVTVDTREDPPTTKPVSSAYVVEVSVVP